jgi:ectoine hydroxylase-related dioxygenase (phytanoyl-CoA dioxygenase family)
VVAGIHKRGELAIERKGSVMLESPAVFDLAAVGLAGAEETAIELDPGDVVMWSAYLLHGSMANTSATLDRRFYVVPYMRSSDCDSGEMAFVDGRPQPWQPQNPDAPSPA